jgi:hypothetical protein
LDALAVMAAAEDGLAGGELTLFEAVDLRV